MPIIPRFRLRQDDLFVFVDIETPYLRVNETTTEIHVDETEFSFYCKPYLLRLSFPAPFLDDEQCKATFQPDVMNGLVTCHLKKATQGEDFKDLDLLTNLMTPKSAKCPRRLDHVPLIQELDAADELDHTENVDPTVDDAPLPELLTHTYGFNRQYSGLFLAGEVAAEVFEGGEMERLLPHRRMVRLEREQRDFDVGRYVGDFLGVEEDHVYAEAVGMTTFWGDPNADLSVTFSEREKETLLRLRPKRLLVQPNSKAQRRLLLNLIDLLFAITYDYRLTQGEHTVDSAANIARLSVNLSWLDSFESDDSYQTVIVQCLRRSLIYPYIRFWEYSLLVLNDVIQLLELGRRDVLKMLLYAYFIFDHTEFFYLFNKSFLDDYCVWIQQIDELQVRSIARDVKGVMVELNKQELCLNLVEIENAALSITEEMDEGTFEKLHPIASGDLLRLLYEKTEGSDSGLTPISEVLTAIKLKDNLSIDEISEDMNALRVSGI